jgi:tetratricopeptide (TPR) repeat protein
MIRLMITTRRDDWPADLGVSCLPLDTLKPAESQQLLHSYLSETRAEDADLDDLADRLGHLPLALELAGRYLRHHSRQSVCDYLRELEKIWTHPSMANWRADLGSPTSHDLNLAATFAVSWQQLHDENARHLLLLSGYCTPNQPIPYILLEKAAGLETRTCDEALAILSNLGLLRTAGPQEGPVIHPLVAEYARNQEVPPALLADLTRALVSLAQEASDQMDQTGDLSGFRPILSHIRSVASLAREQVSTCHLDEAMLLWLDYFTARLLDFEGKEELTKRGYQGVIDNPQAEQRLQAYALCDLGYILAKWQYLGQPGGVDRARSILERSLNLVPLDYHLVNSHSSLAHLYQYLGEWKKSKQHLEKARQFYESRFNNYRLLYTYSRFVIMNMHMGDLKGILEYHRKATALLKDLPQYPYLRNSINTEAGSLIWTGRYIESEQHARDALAAAQEVEDTRGCLVPMGWVSLALALQGKYHEANEYAEKRLGIARNQDKSRIKDLGHAMGTWGIILTQQGRYREAEKHLIENLRIKRKVHEHLWIPRALFCLGALYEAQSDWESALNLYEESLRESEIEHLYYKSATLLGICRVKFHQRRFADIPRVVEELRGLAEKNEFNDHLASLHMIEAHSAWEGLIPGRKPGFSVALRNYQQALIFSLRYNRFLLDQLLWGGNVHSLLRPIIPYCLERGEEGCKMLIALRGWWQAGNNDTGTPRPDTISPISEGISLLEAERIAREWEPGDGSPQTSVIEKINVALAENQIYGE